ncbi:MAG TPA: ABC transporter substrate-binding protein [bacterium]|nr:ABC transporter substrate-binding protein [bacterium]
MATSLAIVAALIAGVLVVPGSVTGWAAGPTTLVYGKSGDADSLDSPTSTNGEAYQVTTQIFNLLVRAQPGKTDIEPDLATSWSVSPDGLTWTFKLRQGVTFHDGTPWNAEAAKANWDRWADKNNPYHAVKGGEYEYFGDFMADSFKEAKAVDPYTLQVILKQPNSPLLQNLTIIAFQFNSPASMKQYGAEGIGQHPVGTGPYKFVEWVRDDHVTLQANPSFFRKGLPKTQRLIMRVIKDNAARYLALKSGEVQAIELPNTDDVKASMSDPNLKIVFRPPFDTSWLKFNMNNSLFKDIRLRKAVAYAINRPAIVQGLYAGYGEVANQAMPPGMWGRASSPDPITYDPAQSKKLLSEAGYPNGFSFDFWYIPVSRPYFPQGKEIGTAIASDLNKVGIRAHLQTEDWATYLKDQKSNRFPMYMAGWIGDNGDPDDWLGFFFPKYDATSARWSYNNPAVFDLINKAKSENSQAKRAQMYAQAMTLISHDLPNIWFAHAKVPMIVRKNVDGLIGQPDSNEYWELVSSH